MLICGHLFPFFHYLAIEVTLQSYSKNVLYYRYTEYHYQQVHQIRGRKSASKPNVL